MKTTFIRVIEAREKAMALQKAIRDPEDAPDAQRFETDPASFREVPGSPFAYWVGNEVRRLFANHPALESRGKRLSIGASTKNDFRYVRLASEVSATEVCSRREDTADCRWVPFGKGGAFSPFFSDIHLLIDWQHDGSSLKADISEYRGSRGWGYQWSAALNGHSHYFRPGLTWPRRTNGLSFRVMPAGCIFADKGPAAFVDGDVPEDLFALCAVANSAPFKGLVALQLARTELAQSYEVGLIQQTPVPDLNTLNARARDRLAKLAHDGWSLQWRADTHDETSHAFVLPALLQVGGTTLLDRAAAFFNHLSETQARQHSTQCAIDDLCFSLYGIDGGDRRRMERSDRNPVAEEDQDDRVENGPAEVDVDEAKTKTLVRSLVSWTVGVCFGRFDIRLATGDRNVPVEPQPFDALSPCSPGMLTDTNGLPINQPPDGYPTHAPPDGVFVDDQGHNFDLVARTRQVFQVVFGEDADKKWQEAEEIIDKRADLRRWFAASFFADHIKRYSKSRRKAPIYWQISTPSARYTVWLYYHRFTKDTLYKVLQDYVAPKCQHEERKLEELRSEAAGYPTAAQRREIESQEIFVDELSAFRAEVARVAPLWKPDLNDGVMINFAPLWRLTPQLPGWQKECKKVWDKLVAGDYDWAHLAMHLWPERVIPKCTEDRSLAITHGLDGALWYEDTDGEWRFKDLHPTDLRALINARTSAAAKEALKILLDTPPPMGSRRSGSRMAQITDSRRRTTSRPQDTGRNPHASGRRLRGAIDQDLVQVVKMAIAGKRGGSSKSDVVEGTGITSSQWNRVIKTLLAEGAVTQSGERGGTRYHLAGADA